MGRRNTFSRALRQLKSEEINKKIQLVETMPTNNTMGVFSTAPDGYEVGTTTVILFVVADEFTTSIPCHTFGLTHTNLFGLGSI